MWYEKRNPDYKDHSNDLDISNFISQCLIAEEENLSDCETDKYGYVIDTGKLENCLKKRMEICKIKTIPSDFLLVEL